MRLMFHVSRKHEYQLSSPSFFVGGLRHYLSRPAEELLLGKAVAFASVQIINAAWQLPAQTLNIILCIDV